MAKNDRNKRSSAGIAAGSLTTTPARPDPPRKVTTSIAQQRTLGAQVDNYAVAIKPRTATRTVALSSLSSPVAGRRDSALPSTPTQTPATPVNQIRRMSDLSINVPAGNSLSRAKSPEPVREPMTCKSRPKDNKPKGGGGGGPRKFVPWCS